MSRPQTKGMGREQERKKGTRLTNSFLQSAHFCLSAQTQLQASAQARWRRLLFLEKKGEGGMRGEGGRRWRQRAETGSVCPKTSGRPIPPPQHYQTGSPFKKGLGRGLG